MKKIFQMSAKTFYGFEDILCEELKKINAIDIIKSNRIVHFKGDKELMYKANLCLRTSLKVLIPLKNKKVLNYEQLYKFAFDFEWENYFHKDSSFYINSVCFGKDFTHSLYVSQRVKDGIVDRFRKIEGSRPTVEKFKPDIYIDVHIDKRLCTFSLNSSGRNLNQRGYRKKTNEAPLNEVLAAGLILLSGWNKKDDFLDPMCGSGTFLFEACMIAKNIPPNLNRKHFAFKNWNDWDQDLFINILKTLTEKIKKKTPKIYGFEKFNNTFKKAEFNIKNSNLSSFISVTNKDFFSSVKSHKGNLHIIVNPPYGVRIGTELDKIYGLIGDTLKKNYENTNAWLISSNFVALKKIGLKPSMKFKIYNGKLESKFLKYEIYHGSKKKKT
ncbi:MAG: class I SAM-dependent RNA methyltransferase [Flavobacteriaceae bacterium]|tara:strand:- start:11390 stop:12541 length:1152 start_codon:yes stop_codon:yes gene_type:complete